MRQEPCLLSSRIAARNPGEAKKKTRDDASDGSTGIPVCSTMDESNMYTLSRSAESDSIVFERWILFRLPDYLMDQCKGPCGALGRKRKNDKLSGMGQDLSDDKLVDSDLLIFSV